MSEFDLGAFQEGYDDAEETAGFVNEPIPKGRYPFKVERMLSTRNREGKAPEASLLIRVTEGALERRTAIITLYLDASPEKKDYNTGEVHIRTDEEFKKARRGAQGRVKGFLTACGASHSNPVTSSPDDVAACLAELFGLENLNGMEFMGELSVSQGKYNNLQNNHPMGHEKYGIEAWRAKDAVNGSSTGGGSL